MNEATAAAINGIIRRLEDELRGLRCLVHDTVRRNVPPTFQMPGQEERADSDPPTFTARLYRPDHEGAD